MKKERVVPDKYASFKLAGGRILWRRIRTSLTPRQGDCVGLLHPEATKRNKNAQRDTS
jgi:hypothetical protein